MFRQSRLSFDWLILSADGWKSVVIYVEFSSVFLKFSFFYKALFTCYMKYLRPLFS